MMSLSFKPELYTAIKQELTPMLNRHWDEMQRERYGKALNIEPGFIESFQYANSLVGVTGRDDKNVLKAYSYGFIINHPLCQDVLMASIQGVFIDKDVRGCGAEFLKYIVGYAKEQYAVDFIDFSTAGNPALIHLLEMSGFKQSEVTMIRRI